MEITAFRRVIGGVCVGLLMAGAGGAQTFFEEVTEETIETPLFPAQSIAWGDYDNDGWLDLFLAEDFSSGNSVVLLHNEGKGGFADHLATLPKGLPAKNKGAGAVFGDYDNDGDLDLFVPIGGIFYTQRSTDVLLKNDQGRFVDVSLQAGLTDTLPSDTAIWLDFDRDGNLDLYGGHGQAYWLEPHPELTNLAYRSNGDGTFTKAEEANLNVAFQGDFGGSNGGLVGGDFNNDGWSDLYVGVWNAPNRLLLNDKQGRFQDVISSGVSDEGFRGSFGAAVGDIDNDGDLDLFQAAGGFEIQVRSVMLLNIGDGIFLDVTEGVGLSGIVEAAQTFGASLADIDNDGDLDLLTAQPHFLYLNNGKGMFVENTAVSGIEDVSMSMSLGDYDRDGFLDVAFFSTTYESFGASREFGGLFRNLGNDNHWLHVETVGAESNRNGIGTRLIATSGNLQQMREVLSGTGRNQDEMVAHFGLGDHTQVDQLEIRWPSGQIDILANISADQKIRVIEGRGEYYPVQPTVWEVPPPESAKYGQKIDLVAIAKPALFEPTAKITAVTGDLSSLGGPEAVPLEDLGDGTYKLEASFVVGGTSELRDAEVFIEQETSLGPYWINLSRNIDLIGVPNTAITENHSATLPDHFSLHQNYPNPFNSSTTIRFALPITESISLSIYNLTGQKVTTLVNGVRNAGEYTIQWDGTNENGNQLASGIYVYRLKSSAYEETKKLLLLR